MNEITGFILAKNARVSVPDRAALLRIPAGAFPGVQLPDFAPYAFAISESLGSTMVSSYRLGDLRALDQLRRIVTHWTGLSKALAFDDWLANQDRNMGNILVNGPDEVVLIDHSNLPIGLNWSASTLSPQLDSINILAQILYGGVEIPHIPLESMKRAANDHDKAYKACCDELFYWWDKLLLLDQERRLALELFIELRAVGGSSRIASQKREKVA